MSVCHNYSGDVRVGRSGAMCDRGAARSLAEFCLSRCKTHCAHSATSALSHIHQGKLRSPCKDMLTGPWSTSIYCVPCWHSISDWLNNELIKRSLLEEISASEWINAKHANKTSKRHNKETHKTKRVLLLGDIYSLPPRGRCLFLDCRRTAKDFSDF